MLFHVSWEFVDTTEAGERRSLPRMRPYGAIITPPLRSLSDEPILIDGLARATLIFFWRFRNSRVD